MPENLKTPRKVENSATISRQTNNNLVMFNRTFLCQYTVSTHSLPASIAWKKNHLILSCSRNVNQYNSIAVTSFRENLTNICYCLLIDFHFLSGTVQHKYNVKILPMKSWSFRSRCTESNTDRIDPMTNLGHKDLDWHKKYGV